MATYLTTEAADALAATLQPPVTSYLAASAPAKLGALEEATRRIDAAYRYQGARYLAGQELEFPRVPFGDASPAVLTYPAVDVNQQDIWDLDPVTSQVVVPLNVRVSCLRQADAILAGDKEAARASERLGLASQSTGGRSEAYVPAHTTAEAMLCLEARALLQRYKLRVGRPR